MLLTLATMCKGILRTLSGSAHREEREVGSSPRRGLGAEDQIADRELHGPSQRRVEERRRDGLPDDHQLVARHAGRREHVLRGASMCQRPAASLITSH